MSREEILDMFNKLEADIQTLQKMIALKDRALELVENGTREEKDQFIEEWDVLEGSLVTVELF